MRIAAESGDVYPSTASTGPSKIKLPTGASVLSKEVIKDKIKGAIYGNCLGYAIGLATEFMSKKEAEKHYPDGVITFENFCKDFHRSRWTPGDWTDDSDQMLLILDGIFANNGVVVPTDFAERLKYWVHHGFPEIGDLAGCGLGQTVGRVVNSKDFLENPHEAAFRVWDRSNREIAPNGGVMRTSVLGTFAFDDMDKLIHNTKQICKTTHADPRCIASCVAVCSAIGLLLRGEIYDESKPDTIKILVDKALEYANKELEGNEKHSKELYAHALAVKLSDLELDESQSIGYTYKAMGSAFYCILHGGDDYRKALTELAMEGGDADSNGAVAGALLGCKIGYNKLPSDLLSKMKEKVWLDKKIDRYFDLLGLNDLI